MRALSAQPELVPSTLGRSYRSSRRGYAQPAFLGLGRGWPTCSDWGPLSSRTRTTRHSDLVAAGQEDQACLR